ncbi:MAG: hypothetical protein ACLFUW_00320 [Bacteroidales bacterium]
MSQEHVCNESEFLYKSSKKRRFPRVCFDCLSDYECEEILVKNIDIEVGTCDFCEQKRITIRRKNKGKR